MEGIAVNKSNENIKSLEVTKNSIVQNNDIRVYRRRLWMLCLFSFLSMLCGMLFPLYVSTANVTMCFYDVGMEAVNWTSMIVLFVYAVLAFPASSLINYMDLRWTVICTSFWNVLATLTQFATLKPNSFIYVMVSCFFASLSDLFVLAVPPVLAAKWFPSQELSKACAFGVFGNQLGIALAFVLPTQIVSSECSQKDLISTGKGNLATILSSVNIVVFILVVFTFQNAPKFPPSISEAHKKKEDDQSHSQVVLSMIKNRNFILVFIMYGMMVGCFFAMSTNLNNLMLHFFPHKEVEIGWMGLLFVVAGLVGSMIFGFILDCTHRFKETAFSVCVASFITCLVFSVCLYLEQIWIQFLTIGIYGFFLTSFLPIGFEYGIEVTYPLPEVVCAVLLNGSTMIFGIIIIEMQSHILESKGPVLSNASIAAVLFLCCIVTSFISKDYKRSQKNAENKCPVPIDNYHFTYI
ncbi:uncharacterized MFS-type transporter C09D4.1 [Caerostris extrusa]|uniref:Uncharacterized MFS-type transporter C09D4.1 n=1 Tax=Caerostris extrusa TaxID=172846 RepID=A0AAV4MDQ4_CAEEX|nr:uncharacterized MFS-type transporter C09D4.1 [Caerostris extrusa]